MKKDIKLTPEVLISIGFIGEGKSITNRPLYRYEWHKNRYQFQMELNDYPEQNQNSGVLSIYYPEMKDQHLHTQDKKENKGKSERIDHITDEDDEFIYGIKFIDIPKEEIPIAWRVTTLSRLNAIFTALTGLPPLKPFKRK